MIFDSWIRLPKTVETLQDDLDNLQHKLDQEKLRTEQLETERTTARELRSRENRATKSTPSRWASVTLSVCSLLASLLTLVYTISQLAPLTKQADAAASQTRAQQRTSDWALVDAISVSIDGDNFVIENRAPSAIMTTATWLVGDTTGWQSFDAIFFELGGVPGCSRVNVPIEGITQDPESIPELPWDEPDEWKWPDFTEAYTYIVAPSGGLYSTSSNGGIVDHGVVGTVDQSSANYGERYKKVNIDWEDPSTLAWVPDTFWEFSNVQVARTRSPMWSGAPLLGKDDESLITPIDCT